MATSVLGLKTFAASDPVDYNEVNDNYVKIDNGVKTAMQGRAVYNLLNNSDYRNPVNQRGQTSYTGSGYTIDRWRSWDSGFSMTVSSGSITVSGGMLNQYIEKSLSGIYTLAAMTSIGTLCLLTANMSDAMTYAGSLGMGSPSEGAQAVSIGPGTYIWAALYEGSYTADTLPAYVPKGYAAELAECQRYYVYINSGAWMTGFYKIGEGLCVEIPTAGNIRINNPTVILDNPKAFTGTGWNNLKVISVSVNRHATKIVFDFVDPSAAQASYGDALIVYGIDSISADM